jgi:hypothetical protein
MTCISLSKWSKVENLYRKNLKNRFKTTRTIYDLQNWCENGRGLRIEPGQWYLAWKFRKCCHGNGVTLPENPPCFWLHFVDWTKYRSRSSSYYTAQWHLPDAILNSAQWPWSQLWCHSIYHEWSLSCIITGGGPAPILRSVNEVSANTWRIFMQNDAISMPTGP